MGYFARRGVALADYDTIVKDLWGKSEVVHPSGVPPMCRDEADRKYLHCAQEAKADFLLTSDQDLLVLGTIGECRIVTPAAFWRVILEDAEPETDQDSAAE